MKSLIWMHLKVEVTDCFFVRSRMPSKVKLNQWIIFQTKKIKIAKPEDNSYHDEERSMQLHWSLVTEKSGLDLS